MFTKEEILKSAMRDAPHVLVPVPPNGVKLGPVETHLENSWEDWWRVTAYTKSVFQSSVHFNEDFIASRAEYYDVSPGAYIRSEYFEEEVKDRHVHSVYQALYGDVIRGLLEIYRLAMISNDDSVLKEVDKLLKEMQGGLYAE